MSRLSGRTRVVSRGSAEDVFVEELPLAALAQPVLAPGAPAFFAFEDFAEGNHHRVVTVPPVEERHVLELHALALRVLHFVVDG